jgi:hypothetical protein
MRQIIVATIVLLFAFAINAEANTNSHDKKCVPLKCLAQHGPKVRISVHRNCEDKRVSKCHIRKRCCEISKRCLLSHFCKTTKKRCYWSGAAYKVGNCAVKRRVCRRVNKRTHKVMIVRKRLHHKHRHGKHHRRHHKHHGKHHRRHHKHHGKHHRRHHKHHGKHHRRHHKHHGKHHKRHHKRHHKHHGKHHKRHHKKHHHKKHKIVLKHKHKVKKVKKALKKRKEHLKKLKKKSSSKEKRS